jgi:hypothetical protein
MGLPPFEQDPGCKEAAEGVRLLLKPAFHPETCLTFADGRVSVVCARELIWRRLEPSPVLTDRTQAELSPGTFAGLLASLLQISDSGPSAVPGITIDGMPVEVWYFRSGTLVLKIEGNGGKKGDFSAFIALAITTAWRCISNSHCRNSLAQAAEYVGTHTLPREVEPPRKPVVGTVFLGSEEDRAQLLGALQRHHDGST